MRTHVQSVLANDTFTAVFKQNLISTHFWPFGWFRRVFCHFFCGFIVFSVFLGVEFAFSQRFYSVCDVFPRGAVGWIFFVLVGPSFVSMLNESLYWFCSQSSFWTPGAFWGQFWVPFRLNFSPFTYAFIVILLPKPVLAAWTPLGGAWLGSLALTNRNLAAIP